ncbi:MAG: PTS mannose/fructose/sorbose/N-acetylgalactosamine transporter subunit IIC [Faecousia sp.]
MALQAFWIFLIALLGYLRSFLGSSNIGRPIILSTLVGLALGDLTTGIMVGATLELVWLGAFAIGASNPPDYTSGSIIGAAYVISTGADVAEAVILAIPVSTLIAMLRNFFMMYVIPLLAAKADKYAEQGNNKGVDAMHYAGVVVTALPTAIIVALGFYFGMPVVEQIVNSIPAWLTNGLDYATGIIPAIGFAMIARMIMNKQLACFFFLGFLLAAYLKLPIIGITGIACVLVAILLLNSGKNIPGLSVAAATEVENDDNEF